MPLPATASVPARPVPSPIAFENIEIRPAELQVFAAGNRVGFTVREYQTFLALVDRYGRVVPRAEIFDAVWGGAMNHRDRSVDVFVRKIRQKLARAAPEWSYIHTHFGIGYRLSVEPRADRVGR